VSVQFDTVAGWSVALTPDVGLAVAVTTASTMYSGHDVMTLPQDVAERFENPGNSRPSGIVAGADFDIDLLPSSFPNPQANFTAVETVDDSNIIRRVDLYGIAQTGRPHGPSFGC
jgi:hypothetical protein